MSSLGIESVRIAGFDVEVREEQLLPEEGSTGQYSPLRDAILIHNQMTQQGKEEVLLHEIMEAIDYKFNLGINHAALTVMCTTLYQVLSDNQLRFGD